MTTQAPTPIAAGRPTGIELPAAGYPMLTRMISNSLFPDPPPAFNRQVFEAAVAAADVAGATRQLMELAAQAARESRRESEPITWIVGQAHPLINNMKVMRMFSDHDGVEVYSVSDDGRAGMRNFVPMGEVRLTEEAMPLDVFIEELADAEDDGEGEPDDPDPGDPGVDPDQPPAPAPAPPPANGQSVS